MLMSAVKSSTIGMIGYDPETCELHVAFKHGGTYSYADVPPELHAEFVTSDSPGGFLHARIKGVFECRKLTPAEAATE